MRRFRLLMGLLAVAVLAVAAVKMTRTREAGPETRDAQTAERVRRFWQTYKQASERRSAGDLTSAVTLYTAALELRPGHEDSLYYSGNCLFELGRYQEAVASYERLIAANPMGSSRGYMQLGLIHASLEPGAPFDLERAGRFFQEALRLDPDSGALLGIGEVALLKGQWEAAWEAFAGDNADNAMGMASPYLLGYLCWRRGDRAEAWRWFRTAVQRAEFKKPSVKWTEEGDVKADPELRWRALAKQSVFGKYWLRLRPLLGSTLLSAHVMEGEYRLLHAALRKQK